MLQSGKILYLMFPTVPPLDPGVVVSPEAKDPRDIPQVSISEYFFGRLQENLPILKDQNWVVDVGTGVSVKFCELEEQSRIIASALTRHGFKKGDVLYYVTYETALLYMVHVAVWRLGGAVRGNFQQDEASEYTRQLRETRSRFILIDNDTIPLLREATRDIDWPVEFINIGNVELAGVISIFEMLRDDGTACPDKVDVNVHDDVVLIPNTSGSTGSPKGVLHTHFTTVAMMDSRASFFFSSGESLITPMSNFAVGNFMVTLNSICMGITVYHLGKFQKPLYIDLLFKLKPTSALMYPFMATWFARSPLLDTLDLSFLKSVGVGGSVLDPTTACLLETRLPKATVSQMYGMSESMAIASMDVARDKNITNKFKIVENEGELCVSSGKLLPYVQGKVVDGISGCILDSGKRGHIMIRTPTLMKGYLVAGAEPNRSSIDKDGWLKTGDIGFFDEDGNIYVKERNSFIFKYYMHFVSPTEIESVLQEHEAVQAAGVVGIPHPETTSLARAFVVLRAGCSATSAQLEQHVAARLPDYMHLHGGVRFIDIMPESKGGKMDRAALMRLADEETGF